MNHPQIAYSIAHFKRLADIKSSTTIYKEINAGRLKTIKVRGRRLVTHGQAMDYIRLLETEAEADQ